MASILFCLLLARESASLVSTANSDDRFVIVNFSDPSSAQKPEPIEVSIIQMLSEGEPEILVTSQGADESHIDAPDGRQYSQLSISGCGAAAEDIGYPEMPVKAFFLEVPYGVDVSVKLVDQSVSSLGGGFLIYPRQRPLPDSNTKIEPAFEINEAAYTTDAFFPASPVVINEPGFIRGRRVVFVKVFPLQYNPVSTELRAFSSLLFQLQFKGMPDTKADARKRRLATRTSEAFVEDLIMNYEPLAPEKSGDQGGVEGLSAGESADYLIIVADDRYDEILPLAEWKHKKGFITYVANMSEVGSTYEDVQNYIQQAYDTWNPAPEYVLLVGDHDDVPAYIIEGHPAHPPTSPSYYWACDQKYTYVDGDDYYPDLTIGRLTVSTELECTDVVDKILDYERTPDNGSWYDDFLAVSYFQDDGLGGLVPSEDDNGIADAYYMETAMTVYDFLINDIQAFSGHKALCTSYWPLTHQPYEYHFRYTMYPHRAELNQIRWGQSPFPDPVPVWIVNSWEDKGVGGGGPATDSIITAINGGVGLVLQRDHGNMPCWGYPYFDFYHIEDLVNGDKTPVVFSISCATGMFDYPYADADCFAEEFLQKSPGGCVGIAAAVRTTYSPWNDLLTHGIFTCFWPTYDPSYTDSTYAHSWRPAEALTYGKYYMDAHFGGGTELLFNLYHWFGDPEMMLRTETPEALSVSHVQAALPDMRIDVTVTVTKGSNPLEGALVAITHPSIAEDYWVGLTNASGSVTFSNVVFGQDNPDNPSDYDVVVSAHNCTPYEGVISIYKRVFCIKNSMSDIVAGFDNLGNLFLKGEHLANAADPIPPDSFIIKDSGNDAVAYIDSQGNLWIDGNLSELCGACSPAGDAFIIRDSSDDNVAYIEFANGNLGLKGKLYENP
jgi:hypothetical protein